MVEKASTPVDLGNRRTSPISQVYAELCTISNHFSKDYFYSEGQAFMYVCCHMEWIENKSIYLSVFHKVAALTCETYIQYRAGYAWIYFEVLENSTLHNVN